MKHLEKHGLTLLGMIVVLLLSIHKCNSQTPQEVYAEIVKCGIKHPDIVMKQSLLETGWYKCNACSFEYNNLFGFRLEKHMTEDNPEGYISFKNWKLSVKYYKWWQDQLYKGGDYYAFLERVGYAEAEGYINALKKTYKY